MQQPIMQAPKPAPSPTTPKCPKGQSPNPGCPRRDKELPKKFASMAFQLHQLKTEATEEEKAAIDIAIAGLGDALNRTAR